MQTSVECREGRHALALNPDPLPALLTEDEWLVHLIAELTAQSIESVRQRLYAEDQHIGANVGAALKAAGIEPHIWSDDLIRFYQQTDAFLYELVAWNRNANKIAIRQWINRALSRLPRFALDILTYGDGIGVDSLYFTQAGHRVTYCDLGDLSKRFAQSLFDAACLPFEPARELTSLPPESFDAIVCLDVLEHVPDPPALLGELVRCLRPGGLLIASAPFFAITPQFPTHLKSNLRYSGSLGGLYAPHGLTLVDGRPFLDPVVWSKPPIVYNAGRSGSWRRTCVHLGAAVLKLARFWSWPHRTIGRRLQRRGSRRHAPALTPAPTSTLPS